MFETYTLPNDFVAPHLSIPSPAVYKAAPRQMGEALKQLLDDMGFDDLEEIGKQLAINQDPPREHCHYSKAIVQDWLDGALVPSQYVVNSLQDMAGEKYEDTFNRFYTHWETATQSIEDITYQYGFLLRHALKIDQGELCSRIKKYTDNISIANIRQQFTGAWPISGAFTEAMRVALTSMEIPEYCVEKICEHYEAIGNLQQSSATGRISSKQRYRPNEIARSLQKAKESLNLTLPELTEHLAPLGWKNDKHNKPYSHVRLSNILSGKSLPDYRLIEGMDKLLSEKEIPMQPTLCVIFDQALRETAETAWNNAFEQTKPSEKLGGMLRAIRLRMGLSQKEMADFLSVSDMFISKHELGKSVPSSREWYGIALYKEYSELVEEWEKNEKTPGGASQYLGADLWFDRKKVDALYQTFKAAINGGDKRFTMMPKKETPRVNSDILFDSIDSTELGSSLHFPNARLPSKIHIEGLSLSTERRQATLS